MVNRSREFLYSDDLGDACVFLLENVNYQDLAFTDESGTVHSHINIGSGVEVSIKDLAKIIAQVVGYNGKILWDQTKLDGTARKLMDCSKLMALGWKPRANLQRE